MLWRHLCLVRAITAAGLLTCSTLGASAAGEPDRADPGRRGPGRDRQGARRREGRRPRRRGPWPGAGPGPRDPQEHLDEAAQRRPPARPGRLQRDGRPGGRRWRAAAASRAWAWAPWATARAASASSPANDAQPGFRSVAAERPGRHAGRDRPRRPEGRRRHPRRLPELRPPHPDAPRQVPAGRRRRLLQGRPGPQGPPRAGHPRHQPGDGPGRHVAGLQQRPLRDDARRRARRSSTVTRSPWPRGSSTPSTSRPTRSTRPTCPRPASS